MEEYNHPQIPYVDYSNTVATSLVQAVCSGTDNINENINVRFAIAIKTFSAHHTRPSKTIHSHQHYNSLHIRTLINDHRLLYP